jgi:hypothetical protein
MKKYFLVISAILFFNKEVYSQVVLDGVYTKSNDEQIADIDKMTQEIKTNISNYKKTQKFKDSTDYKYIFKKDKELQLVSMYSKDQSQGLSYLKEYYFHNERLIFAQIITTEKKYNGAIDKEKMYLDNENLFVWFQGGKKIDPESDKFKNAVKEIRDYAQELRIDDAK